MKPIDITYKTAAELEITEEERESLTAVIDKLLGLPLPKFQMRHRCECIEGQAGLYANGLVHSPPLNRLFFPFGSQGASACWDHCKHPWDATPAEAAKAVVRFLQGE
jgi:hypothetical protein